MKLTLTHLRFLLAAIILIAGSAMVSSAAGPAGYTSGIAVELAIAGDGIARPAHGSDQDSHKNGCRQVCCMNCVPSAGSGCCAAAVSLTSGCKALDWASIAAYGIVDAGLLAAGIDPEALLRPPQTSPEAAASRFSDLFG
ncbi:MULTISPECIES: hypothetical protein [Sinorhizobium/Ensifer group]|nr:MULTISPECIES: hypothetical protein [Sinorhizobium/Ensifer group]